MARSMSLSSPSLAPGAISPLANHCARLILSRSGYTALSVHGKGLLNPILPPSDELTSTFPLRIASYYDVNVDGEFIRDVAWYYPETKEKANHIKNYVAFYKVAFTPSLCLNFPMTVD